MPEFSMAQESLGWLVLAVGVMVSGLGGLLRRRHAPSWWRLGVAALLAGLAGWGWAQGWPAPIGLALGTLAGLQAVQVVVACGSVRRVGARIATLLARPRFQAGVLVAAGAAVAFWQVVRLDMAAQAEMAQTDELFQVLLEPVDLNPVPDRVALTDKGRTIPLFTPHAANSVNAVAERDQLRRMGHDFHLIQTSTADLQYNCHGWVFTGGRYWVRGSAIEQILDENGYKALARPAANDIAIFRDPHGEVLHTALVRSVAPDGAVLLESKWGQLGRFLHNDTKHAYNRGSCTYYRSPRAGHQLRGLDYPKQALANVR